MISRVILSALLLGLSQAIFRGVDFSTLLSVSEFECLKNDGMHFAIPRAWRSSGTPDPNAVQNIKNARAAGIANVDVYLFPCRGKSAADQVKQMITDLASANYGMIWMDVETNPSSGCSWASFSHASNCDYLGELVNAVKAQGKVPGIYASHYMWTEIFGTASACPHYTSVAMWYAHYDGKETFDDYAALSFGGWTKPTVKQYKGTTTKCNAGVDLSFYN